MTISASFNGSPGGIEVDRKGKIEIVLTAINLSITMIFSILTYINIDKTNSLERVDRTLNILSGFSGGEVASSHQELRSFLDKSEPEDQASRTFEADLDIYRKFAPFFSQMRLLAVCYANSHCESEFIQDYTCGSIKDIFSELDSRLTKLVTKPSEMDPETAILIKDCKDYENKKKVY